MSDLRDHSQPCDHGQHGWHEMVVPVVGDPEKVQLIPCFGGREVTLNYPRAIVVMAEWVWKYCQGGAADGKTVPNAGARAVIAAALELEE